MGPQFARSYQKKGISIIRRKKNLVQFICRLIQLFARSRNVEPNNDKNDNDRNSDYIEAWKINNFSPQNLKLVHLKF